MTDNELRELIREKVFVRASDGVHIAKRGPNEYKAAAWLFDFRAIAFDAEVLDHIAETFWKKYERSYPFQVGGAESAAIPLVTAIVLKGRERKKPVKGFFVRKSRKRDGLLKMFEGELGDEPVILVDDIINSGQSLNREVIALSEARKKVVGIFTILAFRDHKTYVFAESKGISVTSMFTLADFGMPLLAANDPEVPRASFDILWRYATGHPSLNYVAEKSAPIIDTERVYFGTDSAVFTALSQETGKVVWTFKAGSHPKGIFSSPALWKDSVIFGAYDGNVYSLNKKTGSLQWRYGDADWVGSSPSVAADLGLLFIGLEFGLFKKHGGVVALDVKTGQRVWEDRTSDFTHGSPLYIREESLVIVGSNDGVLYAYDAKTGKRRWSFQTDGGIKSFPAYDAKRRLILAGSMDGSLYAVHAEDGSLKFSHGTHESIFSTPLVCGDLVYIGSLDKFIYAVDLDTGLPRWHFQTDGRVFASPVIAEHALWVGSNDGRLYELDAETGALRSFFQATERIVNAIAYNEKTKLFFVPTVANELYCLRKK